MAGYWKIEKDWVQRWGLTASEAVVLADILSWDGINGKGCTLKERAERCGIPYRTLLRIIDRLKANEYAKMALEQLPKWHTTSAKMAQGDCQNGTTESAKMAHSPHTPYNNVEEHNEELLNNNGRNAREGSEINLLQVFCDFYRAKRGTEYVPDWRTQSADHSALRDIVRNKATEHGIVWNKAGAEGFMADMLEAMWQRMDEWQRSRFSLRTLVSQFNQLYNQVINPTNNNNNGKQQRNAGLSDEFLAGIARDLAGGK